MFSMEQINLRDYCEIYCITSPSGKKYVGKALIKRKDGRNRGTSGRWTSHVWEANRYKHKGCWLLNNAIRKYGADKFKVEAILSCHINDVSDYEIMFIEKYNTLKPNGYNIALGNASIDFIASKSERNKGLPELPMYINHYYSDEIVGYRVIHPELKSKAFLSSLYTMEQKLEMAIKYIETGECHEGFLPRPRIHEEDNTLPKYVKRRRSGYVVETLDIYKTFTNSIYTMEENLTMALEFLETGTFTPPREWHSRKREDSVDLPKYIIRCKTGYRVQYYLGKKKKICKSFYSTKMTDDENFERAKEFLKQIEDGDVVYEEPIVVEKETDDELPQYVYERPNGYYIKHYPTGIQKSFCNKQYTKQENFEKTMECLNEINSLI